VRDILVGDIVVLNQGDRVPADCILIEEMNIAVDQSMYYNGQNLVSKEQSVTYSGHNEPDNHKEHPDPFLFTDSKIKSGQGRAIVCCVGENTLLAKSRKPADMVIEEQNTDLEKKLEKSAGQIQKYALAATLLSVITHLIFQICIVIFTEKSLFSNAFLL